MPYNIYEDEYCPRCGQLIHPHFGHPQKLCDAVIYARLAYCRLQAELHGDMQPLGDVLQPAVDRAVATHKLLDREVRDRSVADYIRKIRNGAA